MDTPTPRATGSPADEPTPLFHQRSFFALWAGQLISILGDRFTYFALVGLILKHTSHFRDADSTLLLGLAANVMLAPVLLFSPFTGVWLDRLNLKRVLIVSDLLRAGIVFLIPTLYLATHLLWVVFALVFLLFTCNVFFLPARSALTPEIVPASQLLTANALLSVAGVVATALGAFGGWVVDHWGWPTAMRIDAVTYLFSVGTLMLVAYRHRERPPGHATTGRGYVRDLVEGLTLVRRTPTIRVALMAFATVWIGGGFLHVAGNLHVQRAASIPGVERLSVLICALGLGSGLGTWWVNTRGRRWPRALLLGGGLMLVGLGLMAFAVSTRFAVFAIAAFLIGVFVAPSFVLAETMLQEGAELHQRGRVFSVRDFLMRLVFLITVWLAAAVVHAFDTQITLLLCAACVATSGAVIIAWGRSDPTLARAAERSPVH